MTIRIYRGFRSVVDENQRTRCDVAETIVVLCEIVDKSSDDEAIEANVRAIIVLDWRVDLEWNDSSI